MTTTESRDPQDQDDSRTPQSRWLSRVGQHATSSQAVVASLIVLISAVLLEVLPVVAWMIVFSAANNSLERLPLPPWWLCVIVVAAWGFSVVFRRRSGPQDHDQRTEITIRLVTIAGWALALSLSLLLSPGAYAGMPLEQVIASILSDVVRGTSRLAVDLGLAILVAYLWWRGLLLGRLPLTRERLFTRGLWGGIALVASLVLLNNIAGSAGAQATALLALLLPAYIFIGLTGLGLAHLLDTAREHQRRQQRAVSLPDGPPGASPARPQALVTRAWIISALGLSTAIVGGALILGLVLSYNSVQSLAHLLHPVADAFGTVLMWLVEALAFVLFLLLNPIISWLHNFFLQREKQGQTTSPTPPSRPQLPNTSLRHVPPDWLLAGRIALLVIVVLVLALAFWWVLRRFASWHRNEEFEEEREALSASEVLGAQLRALVAGWRRPKVALRAEVDPLAPESVRYLYRTVLERAGAAGLGRQPNETPDEYERRLQVALLGDGVAEQTPTGTKTAPGTLLGAGLSTEDVQGGLEELTIAYDQVRYGSQLGGSAASDGPASPGLGAAVSSIVGWLSAKGAGKGPSPRSSQRLLWRRQPKQSGGA
jgi:Domain of unknown function (DUF4129)